MPIRKQRSMASESAPAPDPSATIAAATAALDDAWDRFRADALKARREALSALRKDRRAGRSTVPLVLQVPEPPELRPEWFGSNQQPTPDDPEQWNRDTNGGWIRQDPKTGRWERRPAGPAPEESQFREGTTETETYPTNTGELRTRTVQSGQVGDNATTSDVEQLRARAREVAAIRDIDPDEAFAELREFGDDGLTLNAAGQPIRYDQEQGRYVPAQL